MAFHSKHFSNVAFFAVAFRCGLRCGFSMVIGVGFRCGLCISNLLVRAAFLKVCTGKNDPCGFLLLFIVRIFSNVAFLWLRGFVVAFHSKHFQ